MKKSSLLLVFLITFLSVSSPSVASSYYGAHLCGYPGFKCIQVKRGDTWARMFPNARDREIVKRLNRTNISLKYRSWIVVPKNLKDITLFDLSPFPAHKDTGGSKEIIIDINKQAFGAYNTQGELVHWGPISAGKSYCPDLGRACTTITGNFKIYRKQGSECESSKYPLETNGGAPMPYCMHFHQAYAIHGSTLPGFNASHGCVRVFFDDAKWLNLHFADIGTRVIVLR